MLNKHNSPRQEPISFQTFDHTIRDICAYMGDDEAKTLYIKVARFLRLSLEELNLYLIPKAIKSVVLEVNSNMTVDLPNDFNTLGKVGVCCDGEIRLIGQNNDLCLKEREPVFDCCDCVNDTKKATNGGSCCASCTFHNVDCSDCTDEFYNNYITNQRGPFVNYLYGYTPKMWKGGTYRLDEANNRLIMGDGCDVYPGAEIIVEYNAALSDDQYDLIPKKAVPTLMYKTASMIKADKNPSAANNDFRQFKIHYRQLKKTYSTVTLDDLVAALRGTYKSSPKR